MGCRFDRGLAGWISWFLKYAVGGTAEAVPFQSLCAVGDCGPSGIEGLFVGSVLMYGLKPVPFYC